MPKYDLAGNPLPEPNSPPPPSQGLPPRGPAPALPPRTDAYGRPIHAAPPPAVAPAPTVRRDLAGNPLPESTVRYDLAGNPMPQTTAPPPTVGAWTPPAQPGTWPPPPAAPGQYANPYAMPAPRNTSGEQGDVPPEIARLKWNWGAFCIPRLWCYKHGLRGVATLLWASYFLLRLLRLAAASEVGLFGALYLLADYGLAIYLGFQGHRMAWRNRHFPGGLTEYFQVQRAWMIWGLILQVAIIGFWIFIFTTLLTTTATNGAASPYNNSYHNSYNSGYNNGGYGNSGGQ